MHAHASIFTFHFSVCRNDPTSRTFFFSFFLFDQNKSHARRSSFFFSPSPGLEIVTYQRVHARAMTSQATTAGSTDERYNKKNFFVCLLFSMSAYIKKKWNRDPNPTEKCEQKKKKREKEEDFLVYQQFPFFTAGEVNAHNSPDVDTIFTKRISIQTARSRSKSINSGRATQKKKRYI